MKARIKISVTINECSLKKSTSKAQAFKTVKFSISIVQVIFFCFFIYSNLFSCLIYSLSKKELKGKMNLAIVSVKTVKLAMENVHSLF